MKYFFIGVLLLSIVVIVRSAFVIYKINSQKPAIVPQVQGLAVSAQNGTFSPSDFRVERLQSLTLQITAVDRDYVFDFDPLTLHKTLPKGSTTEVLIDGSEIGTLPYICGDGCGGMIEFYQKPDMPGEE